MTKPFDCAPAFFQKKYIGLLAPDYSDELLRLHQSYRSARHEMERRWAKLVAACSHPREFASYECYVREDTLGNLKGSTQIVKCGICLRNIVEDSK